MSANSQFHKIISVLLIFILMTDLSGCSMSGKLIQTSVLPLKKEDGYRSNYAYLIYSQRIEVPSKSKYRLIHVSKSNGYLTGEIQKGVHWHFNYVLVLLPSDSLIKVSSDKYVKIALADISEVRIIEDSYILFGVSCAVMAFLVTIMIAAIIPE